MWKHFVATILSKMPSTKFHVAQSEIFQVYYFAFRLYIACFDGEISKLCTYL